jgi:hypothetical protein
MLWNYAFGKPKERIEVTGFDISSLNLFLVEARNGANGYGNGSNGDEAEPVTIDVEPSKDDEESGDK